MFNSFRVAPRLPFRAVRWNSTTTPVPPLMAKMRSDLKTAMKAKDSTRLDVLRALISEYNNLAKTTKPLKSDIDLLALIQKRMAGAREAAQEFSAANRPDLKEQQDSQLAVLDEYAKQVNVLSREEIQEIVKQEISKLKDNGDKPNIGIVIARLFSENGALNNKAQTSMAAQVVKEVLSAS